MTMELVAGEEPIGQLATTLGWTNAVQYIGTLDEEDFPTLRSFAREGYCEDLDLLQDEAEDAADKADDQGVKEVLENLAKLLDSTDEDFVLID